MSVVKNSVGVTNDVTIMRFLKDTALASPPLPSGHPLIGCVAKKALEINKVTFQLGFYPRQGETVLIKCELEQYSFGCIYGINNRKIYKTSGNDSKIQWMNGSTVVAQVDWDDDIHTYGWLGGVTNGTRWCKPIYDGRILSDTTNTNGYSNNKAWLCTSSDASETNFRSDSTWAMRLYEVYACSYPDASDNTMYLFHYYAAVNSSSVACLMETRHDLTTLVGSLGSGYRKEVINFTTQEKGYGIQLHDLKTITNSGLHDLMALWAEDGSHESGADNPDVITNGTNSFNMAFRLANGRGNTITDPIPLPSGFSLSRTGIGTVHQYIKGDLVVGRRPKWNIWNDAIKVCKYVRNMTQDSISKPFFMVNLFKDHNGDDYSEILLRLEGYSSANEDSHEPHFDVPSSMDVEYHNRVAAMCIDDNRIIGGLRDAHRIYKYSIEAPFVGSVNIGNLAPWNIARADLVQRSNWIVWGAAIIIEYELAGNYTNVANVAIYGDENDFFSASSTTDKTKFRDGDIVHDKAILNEENLAALFYLILADSRTQNNQRVLPCTVQIGLLQNSSEHEVTVYNLIKTEYVIPDKPLNILPYVDVTHHTTTLNTNKRNDRDRFVIGENGGVCKFNNDTYVIGVMTCDSRTASNTVCSDLTYIYSDNNNSYHLGDGIGAPIGLIKNGQLANIVDNIIAFIEVTLVKNDANGTFYGKYYAFTMPESLAVDTNAAHWEHPFYISGGTEEWGLFDQNGKVWPDGIFVSSYDFSTTRACLWRWRDILHNNVQEQSRPQDNNEAIPMTAHMRIFENTSNNKGPVAWSIYNFNVGWDAVCGQEFQHVKWGGTYYRLYVVSNERIMPYDGVGGDYDNALIAECWFSVWEYNSRYGAWRQKKPEDSFSLPSNFGFELYETPLHTAHQKAGSQQTYAAPEIESAEVADITLPNTRRAYDGNYSAEVSAMTTYIPFTWLPSGTDNPTAYGWADDQLPGFFRLRIWKSRANYTPGSFYEINFKTES